jgi:hypothetical protein
MRLNIYWVEQNLSDSIKIHSPRLFYLELDNNWHSRRWNQFGAKLNGPQVVLLIPQALSKKKRKSPTPFSAIEFNLLVPLALEFFLILISAGVFIVEFARRGSGDTSSSSCAARLFFPWVSARHTRSECEISRLVTRSE